MADSNNEPDESKEQNEGSDNEVYYSPEFPASSEGVVTVDNSHSTGPSPSHPRRLFPGTPTEPSATNDQIIAEETELSMEKTEEMLDEMGDDSSAYGETEEDIQLGWEDSLR